MISVRSPKSGVVAEFPLVFVFGSFVPEADDRVQIRGAIGGIVPEKEPDTDRHRHTQRNPQQRDRRRNRRHQCSDENAIKRRPAECR